MIIDFHGHVGSWISIGAGLQQRDIVRTMDCAGIKKACVFNIFHSNAALGNKLTAQFVAAYPDRFIGFSFVTPHYMEEIERELLRGVEEFGMKGIKIYPPYFNRSVEDPAWEPIFAFAHAQRLPVIAHTDGDDPIVKPNHAEPQMFVPWARKYPHAKIILAHAGNFKTGRQSCIRAAQSCPNIFIEICSSWRHFGAIEELVQGAGEERILFGSDMPLMDPRIQIGRVITAEISDTAKNKILGDNAARLLGF